MTNDIITAKFSSLDDLLSSVTFAFHNDKHINLNIALFSHDTHLERLCSELLSVSEQSLNNFYNHIKNIDYYYVHNLAHLVTMFGNTSILKSLVEISENAVDVNQPVDENHKTLLHIATELNQINIVNYLIEKQVEITYDTDGFTALHHAAANGYTEIANSLLNIKDVNLIDWPSTDGGTPLHQAAEFGHTTTAQLLLEHKANVNLLHSQKYVPLWRAVKNGHADTASLLLKYGTPVDTIVDDITFLYLAAKLGYSDVVQVLLEHKSDINFQVQTTGLTPLHIAVIKANTKVIETLLADPNIQINLADNNGFSALHLAVKYRQIDIVKMLLKHGANEIQKALNNFTPLDYAKPDDSSKIYQLLLENISRKTSPLALNNISSNQDTFFNKKTNDESNPASQKSYSRKF